MIATSASCPTRSPPLTWRLQVTSNLDPNLGPKPLPVTERHQDSRVGAADVICSLLFCNHQRTFIASSAQILGIVVKTTFRRGS